MRGRRPNGIPRQIALAMPESGAPAPQPLIELRDLTRRNLFQTFASPISTRHRIPVNVPVVPPTPPPPPPIPISQKIAQLRLVGILNGRPPQAIIEDQRSQKTLYLGIGQTIDDVEVAQISGDRVVLRSAGEQTELAL